MTDRSQLIGMDERVPLLPSTLDGRQSDSPLAPSPVLSRTSSIASRSSLFLERDVVAGRVRLNGLRNLPWTNNSKSLILITCLLLPQVLAAIILLPRYWDSENCTNSESPLSLRVWILGDALVKGLQLMLLWSPFALILARSTRGTFYRFLRFKRTASFAIDVFSVVWVVQGTNYFFATSTDDDKICNAPHLFRLGQVMYALSMFIMTLPVLLCLLFVPLACCCFPCFVRFLLAMRVDSPMVGATAQDLATLSQKAFDPDTFDMSSDDDSKIPQCAICLSTYIPGEMIRELPCDSRHHFHASCVDDWLKLNATCPVCRSKVFHRANSSEESTVEDEYIPIDSPV